MLEAVLPKLHSVEQQAGVCAAGTLSHCRVSGMNPDTLTCVREDFPEWHVATDSAHGYTAIITQGTDENSTLREAITPPEVPEGYAVRITPEDIHIEGSDAAGLWYGLQTLRVLLDAGTGELPCGEIVDWPVIRQRGIHIDLKGCQPQFARLLETVKWLSRVKINTILLEIEDKYAFRTAPEVAVPEAYSYEQMRALSVACQARHIQVIPKLQCLGHVDYLLRHERFRALREDGHPYQYCPRNPDGFTLWSAMAEELLDAFREHDYFHIGADEAGNLGQCPVCREYPRADTFIHRVRQCIDFITAHGKTPIMWEDILRNLHGLLDPAELERTWSLGQDAVLMYWAYGYGGAGNAFPFLPRYLEKGLQVWGASGLSGCGPSWVQNVPPLPERAKNIAAWTATANEFNLPGVVATAWTRIASADPPAEPLDSCWFTMLYAAESMWAGHERDLEPFCQVAHQLLFGEEIAGGLLHYLLDGNTTGLLPNENNAATRNGERLRLLTAAARYDDHEGLRKELYTYLHMYHDRLGAQLADYRVSMLRRKVTAFRESWEHQRTPFREALAALYEPSTVEDILLSRFGRDEVLLQEMETLLSSTAPV